MHIIENTRLFVPVAAVSLLAYFLVSTLLAYRRLKHFPGPIVASFSYLYMFRVWMSKHQAASYKDLNKTYRSHFVRIGPNDLITDDLEMIRRMNSARSKYGRSSWYIPAKLNPYDDSLINMVDTKEHDKLKAKMSLGYGGKENPELEIGIAEQLEGLVGLIRSKYISSGAALKPLDFAKVAQFFTLDAITRVAYGKAFGFLATEQDVFGYMAATDTGGLLLDPCDPGWLSGIYFTDVEFLQPAVPILALGSDIPLIGKIMISKPVIKLVGPKTTDSSGMGKLLGQVPTFSHYFVLKISLALPSRHDRL